VCAGRTGHSEALKIDFDPTKISYGDLLAYFFRLHDYTRPCKDQYASKVFYQSDAQRRTASSVLAKLPGRPATDLRPAAAWHDAEEYHQCYHEKMRARTQPH